MSYRDDGKLSDNWRFAESGTPVDETTFDDYVVKYGEERARGYLEAIADIRAESAWMLTSWNPISGGHFRSASKTQVMLKNFIKHKEKLMKYVSNHPIIVSDEGLLQKLEQK